MNSSAAIVQKWDKVSALKRTMRPLVLKLLSNDTQECSQETIDEFNRLRAELIALDPLATNLGPYPWDKNATIIG